MDLDFHERCEKEREVALEEVCGFLLRYAAGPAVVFIWRRDDAPVFVLFPGSRNKLECGVCHDGIPRSLFAPPSAEHHDELVLQPAGVAYRNLPLDAVGSVGDLAPACDVPLSGVLRRASRKEPAAEQHGTSQDQDLVA